MRFDVSCPNCGKTAKAPVEYIGKKVRCAKCGGKFRVPPPETEEDDDVDEFDAFKVPFDEDELDDLNAEPTSPKRSPNLSDCPDCGGMVSKSAFSCPHCGRPLRGKAVECYLTIHRYYAEAGSVRVIGLELDGSIVNDLEAGESTTIQTTPGSHTLAVGFYNLLGGHFSPSLKERFDITVGQHLIYDFTPAGGLLGASFVGEWSEKIV